MAGSRRLLIHGRNHAFGADNCSGCHKDYGMYGYVITKAGGMRHVYLYLTEYKDGPALARDRRPRLVARAGT